jgi:hypothetical protein
LVSISSFPFFLITLPQARLSEWLASYWVSCCAWRTRCEEKSHQLLWNPLCVLWKKQNKKKVHTQQCMSTDRSTHNMLLIHPYGTFIHKHTPWLIEFVISLTERCSCIPFCFLTISLLLYYRKKNDVRGVGMRQRGRQTKNKNMRLYKLQIVFWLYGENRKELTRK